MTSNDERREVAARLREYAYLDHTSLPWYLQKAVHGNFSHIDEPSDGETFSRLADLIEPEERTCHVVRTIRYDYEGGYAGTEYETELSCGHKHTDSYDDAPNFCSECGAKVVEQ